MKRPGHCTLCETPVREIVSKHTKGKLNGEPIKLGPWLENAWRVSYLMSDGAIADITFCKDCCEVLCDENFDEIRETYTERFLWEEENRTALSPAAPERTAVQQRAVEKELDRVLNLRIQKEVGRRMWKYV